VLGPTANRGQRVLERAALLGQFVLHAHRCLRDDDAREDPLRLQFAQPLRQHAIADVWNGATQLGKTHPPLQQELYDGARPSAADQLHRVVKPRA